MLSNSGSGSDKYCYSYWKQDGKWEWCWLTATGAQDYVKEGDGGWACEDYDGYKDSDYCEGAAEGKEVEQESSSTSGKHEEPSAMKAEEKAGDKAGQNSDADEMKEMLDLHNMYRCMAGVDKLEWDDDLQKQAQSWADTGNMGHSTALGAFKKYGENMQMKCPKDTPKDATDWWYDEIKKYKNDNTRFSASHYTQMVWKGTKKIGCGKGKAPSSLGCQGDAWVCQFTPMGNNNYNDGYKKNVFAPTKSKAQCGGSRLYSRNVPNVGFAQSSAMLGAAAFFAVIAFFTVVAGFRLRQTRRAATPAVSELEPLEAGEEDLGIE
jgi:hypothetical protein